MADNLAKELIEKISKIETILISIEEKRDLKNEILEEKIRVANHRIDDLENSHTWLVRAVAAALISAVIAFLI